jgi:hypothetical protein
VPADTGFPRADVENDFLRVRRRQVLARLAQRLRREPDDVNLILPFDEVVATLGFAGERPLGLQTIQLDSVVGTVDSMRDFDRRFRPTSSRIRERWERLALAERRGESIPPIDVSALTAGSTGSRPTTTWQPIISSVTTPAWVPRRTGLRLAPVAILSTTARPRRR